MLIPAPPPPAPPPASPPPIVQPAPAPPPPPPAPDPPPAPEPAAPPPEPPTPIPQPGVSYIDPDSLPPASVPLVTPGETVPGAPASSEPVAPPTAAQPPSTAPPAGTIPQPGQAELTPDDIDANQALADAEANDPDLSGLPDVEIEDPFAAGPLVAVKPPLKGQAAADAIVGACSTFQIDTLACLANALNEGWQGNIGDHGLAYGPFQDHLTEFPGRPFYGKGANNDTVNEWAWTANGINYSVRQMATSKPSAKDLVGHAAVAAIVAGYEKPTDTHGEIIARDKTYDKLKALGNGAFDYAASQLAGPVSGGAVGTLPPDTTGGDQQYVPPGLAQSWSTLLDKFKTDLPKEHAKVKALGESLMEVVK